MPDVCDLILDDHETIRRRFAELDEYRHADTQTLQRLWRPLATLLELHAAVEEHLVYPSLLDTGTRPKAETGDAIRDHNEIRDAVERASSAQPGSSTWWEAVVQAREHNSDHMAEEERGAIADLRAHPGKELRRELGAQWLIYQEEHAGLRGVEVHQRDPEAYLEDPG